MAKSIRKEEEKGVGPKARNDAYVMILFSTFLAIVAGCVLTYLDNQEYGAKSPPMEPIPTVHKLGDA
jgi:hypothetical protein